MIKRINRMDTMHFSISVFGYMVFARILEYGMAFILASFQMADSQRNVLQWLIYIILTFMFCLFFYRDGQQKGVKDYAYLLRMEHHKETQKKDEALCATYIEKNKLYKMSKGILAGIYAASLMMLLSVILISWLQSLHYEQLINLFTSPLNMFFTAFPFAKPWLYVFLNAVPYGFCLVMGYLHGPTLHQNTMKKALQDKNIRENVKKTT